MTGEEFAEINALEEGTVILEPFDVMRGGIVGITEDHCHIVYGYDELVAAMRDDFMANGESYENAECMAIEWLEYNTIRALPYMPQERRPIIIIHTEE